MDLKCFKFPAPGNEGMLVPFAKSIVYESTRVIHPHPLYPAEYTLDTTIIASIGGRTLDAERAYDYRKSICFKRREL